LLFSQGVQMLNINPLLLWGFDLWIGLCPEPWLAARFFGRILP
jgi:hypothetical protein